MQHAFRLPQWSHLFYFLLQGVILILKCSRYSMCLESMWKMYMFCIFTFVFFFERSMQIPIQISTGSIEDKEIEYFTFSYLHGSWLLILWLHCAFCNKKKGTFGIFTGYCHLQTSETSGRTMAVELDSRHPLLPKTGCENEDLTLILRGKNGNFYRFQIQVLSMLVHRCKRKKNENKQKYNC